MTSFDMGRVPPVTFGAGRRRSDLPGVLEGLIGGKARVLLVADAILAELGPAHEMVEDMKSAGFGVDLAAEISGEPKEALVDALADRARIGCSAVIGLGGGAAMDAAKLVAAIAPAPEGAAHYVLSRNPFPARGLPTIAVPTTAGTGSEVTRTSIVSTSGGLKNWYWAEELMFDHALLDPELTLTLPPAITAWTGIDAVAHALEAVTSKKSNPAGQFYGLEALRILAETLPRAVADGADLEIRGRVQWASMIAGLALHNCNTHMGHNISHALGSLAPVHHGRATGLALEVTLPRLVLRSDGARNYAMAARALGGSDLPEEFIRLMRACGIERSLPACCAPITAEALAAQMKSSANRPMADNAACAISDADLDGFAQEMTALALQEAVA
ncbi:MAG: iron-containing alcohol dehydrogenase [Pseudomonadota bacterium]